MFKFIVLIVCAMTLTAFAQGGEVRNLTVDEAVVIALENNLSLRRNALDIQIRQRNADRAWTDASPYITTSALALRPTSIINQTEPPRDAWQVGFQAVAGVNLSLAVFENIKRARADYEVGVLTLDQARQELELQVRRLFYHILLLDANREFAQLNFNSARERHEESEALARVGQVPHLTEMSARVDMENYRPAILNAEIQYENAKSTFKTILGINLEEDIRLSGDLNKNISENISSFINSSDTSLYERTLLKNIEVMNAQREFIRVNSTTPSLRVEWRTTPLYNLSDGRNPVNNERYGGWSDNGEFRISLNIGLDNFFRHSPARLQMENLSDNIYSAQIQLNDYLRNRDDAVSSNVRTINRIMSSLEAMRLNIELAQTTYGMHEEAYRMGETDLQQLRSARDGLEQARNRLLQEQYSLIIALLDLEKELNVPFGTLFRGE